MTVRMSVPGPVRVIADSDMRQWKKYGGKPLAPRPIQFTLQDHTGLCNEFFSLLEQYPAGRLPRKVAERLLAWKIDVSSGCPKCGDEIYYLNGLERQHYGWNPSSGFTINGEPSILPTSDRPKGVCLGCDCGFQCEPWSLGGMRPRLRMALDLGYVENMSSLSHINSEKRKDGSLRLGIRDDDGWYSITRAGKEYLDSVDRNEESAKASIQLAISSFQQLSESVPKPEILTSGSRRNTIEASLTEGPIFRDYVVFLLDSTCLDKEEDRLFHALYGQNFKKECNGCRLNQTVGCSILQHLGTTASSDGCRPNLNMIIEQYRNGVIRWNEYALTVRGKVKTGFRRLETISGKEICLMEWTHQVDKETSLLKFVTEGAGWVTAGSRKIPSIPIINERMLPNVESSDYRRENDNNGEWAPSSGLLFCMGLKGD